MVTHHSRAELQHHMHKIQVRLLGPVIVALHPKTVTTVVELGRMLGVNTTVLLLTMNVVNVKNATILKDFVAVV